MKKKKGFKKLLSLLVSAVMLVSVLSIAAFAEDSVPTSDAYSIDVQTNTVHILKNTFVGDFLRRIDSHDSVKKVVDANGADVFAGVVTDAMKLKVGETLYSIICKDSKVLYDLATLLEDETLADGQVIFNATKTEDARFNTYFSTMSADSPFKKLFISGSYPSEPEVGAYLKLTVRKPQNEKPYIELETNSSKSIYLLSNNFPEYANESTYGMKIVSELDIKSIDYTGAPENASGLFGMTHYFTGVIDGKADTAMADRVLYDSTYPNSDFVTLSNRNYLTMGGLSTSGYAASSMFVAKSSAYTAATEINLRQVTKIFDPATIAEDGFDITGLYLNNEKVTGSAKYNSATSFNIPLKEGVTALTNMMRGAINIAVNRYSNTSYGEKTVVKLYNYSVNMVEEIDENIPGLTGNSTAYNSLVNSGSEENGYVFTTASPRGVANILPGTTVKEFIESIDKALPAHCLTYVTDKNKTVYYSDDALVRNGMYLQLVANGATSYATRGYALSLATVDDAIASVTDNVQTVSRKSTNNVLGTFVFAAYDSDNKLIAAKTSSTPDAQGVRSVAFDGIAASDISYVKSFLFNSWQSMKPLVINTTPTAN